MKKLILLFVLFNTPFLFSQTVSTVQFNQRTDGTLLVDITYNLETEEAVTITVEASRNGGTDWDVTCETFLEGGAFGEGIEENEGEDKGKSIVWDFFADTGDPGESGDDYVVKVTAEIPGPLTGTLTIGTNTYNTVKIGDQWWMAENLRETHYRNGDEIPEVTVNATWAALTTGARCSYNNSSSNADTYGYLYNWYAAADARNLAPAGWRVPSDADWTALTDYLIANGYNWDGTTTGNKIAKAMASTSGWDGHGTAGNVGNDQSSNNASGFSALPAGFRIFDGGFNYLGTNALFWSATEYDAGSAWARRLNSSSSDVDRGLSNKQLGFSVRLVRD